MPLLAKFVINILLVLGLLFNFIGALTLASFYWRPLRELGYYVKPEYERIDEGLRQLTGPGGGELISDDDGFDEITERLLRPHEVIMGISTDRLEPTKLELSDDGEEVTLHLENPPFFDDTDLTMSYSLDLLRESLNTDVRRGYIKAGVVLVAGGFLMQLIAQLIRFGMMVGGAGNTNQGVIIYPLI